MAASLRPMLVVGSQTGVLSPHQPTANPVMCRTAPARARQSAHTHACSRPPISSDTRHSVLPAPSSAAVPPSTTQGCWALPWTSASTAAVAALASAALVLLQPGTAAAAVATTSTLGGTTSEVQQQQVPAAVSLPLFTSPDVASQLPPLPTSFPPLPELRLPKYSMTALPNGLRVFLLEDHEVALVRGTLLMRGGQYASPPDKVGLATISAGVQRAGGSAAHPAPLLNERLEQLAASIEMGAGAQALNADFACLAEDSAEVLSLFAEVVRAPVLPTNKLSLYQAQVLNLLEHQNDSPGSVSRRKALKLVYGPDSIYARTPTQEAIKGLTVEDIRAFVQRWERPDTAVLGIVGDFRSSEMLALVKQAFGDWAPAAGQPAAPPAVPREPLRAQDDVEGKVFLVDRPGLTQANIVSIEPGVSLQHPDVYALDVTGTIFNSFGGTLFDTLRSREGLAYSVAAQWDSPLDHTGVFVATGQTSAPGEFLQSLRSLLSKATSEPPPAELLATAKDQTLNSFVFNFGLPASQLQRILVYDLLGLPQDYLFTYNKGLAAVGAGDVLRATSAHLHPERQTVVVTADRELAEASLRAAGLEVTPLPLED